MSVSIWAVIAQQAFSQQSGGATIQVTVVDSAHKPVADASVLLAREGSQGTMTTRTSAEGIFVFSALRFGTYRLSAEKSGRHSRAAAALTLSKGDQKHIDLVLEDAGALTRAMEFNDQPDFVVAGVTDWTAAGGHGSDSSLRTSEDLARETLTLKPESPGNGVAASSSGIKQAGESESRLRARLASAPGSFEANHQLGEFYFHSGRYREAIPRLQTACQIDPTNYGNEYDVALAYKVTGDLSRARDHAKKMLAREDKAELHSLAGDLDEKLGEPLAAVHEYEQAVRLDASEQNYFEWGSELLLHRAVRQAAEVFRNGAKAHPKSARMLAALGTALFASAQYDEAALRLCDASDLNPTDPEPYIFLGKIEIAAPNPLACVEPKLARFVQQQPDNALANYFSAMSIWKRQASGANPQAWQQAETLLTKAVTIDPKCGDAYLQLGILYSAQRNPQQAISFYRKAVEANSQLGEAHYRLGVAYDRIGESARAKEEFQLHDEIERRQAAAIESQRREVKQFLVVLQSKPASQVAH